MGNIINLSEPTPSMGIRKKGGISTMRIREKEKVNTMEIREKEGNMLFAIRCKDGKYVLVNKKDQTARPVSLEEALRHTRDIR
jgi:hypothetical protein